MNTTKIMRRLALLSLLGPIEYVLPGWGLGGFSTFGAFALWGSENKILRSLSYLGFLGLILGLAELFQKHIRPKR